ncbi:MAG: tetratricopeptide repeat protein [Planctomycetota bacterium]
MEQGERQIGILGWVFLTSVLVLVIVMVLLFAPRGAKEAVPVVPGEKSEEGSTRFLRVDDKVLADWVARAEPIAQCSDAELLNNLSRGAEARARVAVSFQDADNASKWSVKAIEAYERLAVLSPPGKGNPYRHISLLYAASGNAKDALEYERKHIAWKEKAGESPERLTLSALLMQTEDYEAAVRELRRVLEGEPNDLVRLRAHMFMGDCLRKTDKVPEAIQAYGRAIDTAKLALENSTPQAFDKKGTYLFRPMDSQEQMSSVEWIGEPPDSPRVRELVEKRGYRIANAEMRASRIAQIKALLQELTERYAALLNELGMPPQAEEGPETPSSQPAPASRPQ